MDWYGRGEAQARWRQRVNMQLIAAIIQNMYPTDVRTQAISGHNRYSTIQDSVPPPFPTQQLVWQTNAAPLGQTNAAPLWQPPQASSQSSSDTATFPTEARLRAKQRLMKMKEQGLKPTKRVKIVEPGDDDW